VCQSGIMAEVLNPNPQGPHKTMLSYGMTVTAPKLISQLQQSQLKSKDVYITSPMSALLLRHHSNGSLQLELSQFEGQIPTTQVIIIFLCPPKKKTRKKSKNRTPFFFCKWIYFHCTV
jgi:hypothetical protein